MRVIAMLFARHLGAASCSRTRPWPEARFAQQLCRYSTQQLLHPTAVIGARAKVGEGVRIGPFCVVSDGAIIGPNCDLESGVHILGNTILGAGCVIRSHAVVGAEVPGSTVLGRDNIVGSHAVVGSQCQDKKYVPGSACNLCLGDGNDIREHAQVHRSSDPEGWTRIGDGNLLMGSCHIGHDCVVGNGNTISNHSLLAGHVTVGDNVVIGGAVAIQQFVTIGSYAFIAGGSKVDGSVPSCMRAAGDRAELRGVNVIGLRRNGFSSQHILETMKVVSKLWRPVEATSRVGGSKYENVHLIVPDTTELMRRAEALLAGILSDVDTEVQLDCGEAASADNLECESSSSLAPAALLLRFIIDSRSRDNSSTGVAHESLGRAGLCLWRNASEFDRIDINTLQERINVLEEEIRTSALRTATMEKAAVEAQISMPINSENSFDEAKPSVEALPDAASLGKLRVKELQALLEARGLDVDGMKYELVARLDRNRALPVSAEAAALKSAARKAAQTAWNFMHKQMTPPKCLGHRETCAVRVVKKNGPNFGRIYFVCPRSSFGRVKNPHPDDCGFFQWAHSKRQSRSPHSLVRVSGRSKGSAKVSYMSYEGVIEGPTTITRGVEDKVEDNS